MPLYSPLPGLAGGEGEMIPAKSLSTLWGGI